MRQREEPFEEIGPEEPVGYWVQRFGVDPEDFAHVRFYRRNDKMIWVAAPSVSASEGLPVQAMGFNFMRTRQDFPKPTTPAVLAFGHLARRNVVEVSWEQLEALLQGRVLDWEAEGLEHGYVIMRCDGLALGCGLWLNNTLKAMVPKTYRQISFQGAPGCGTSCDDALEDDAPEDDANENTLQDQ